jgi:hypothetical protein
MVKSRRYGDDCVNLNLRVRSSVKKALWRSVPENGRGPFVERAIMHALGEERRARLLAAVDRSGA